MEKINFESNSRMSDQNTLFHKILPPKFFVGNNKFNVGDASVIPVPFQVKVYNSGAYSLVPNRRPPAN